MNWVFNGKEIVPETIGLGLGIAAPATGGLLTSSANYESTKSPKLPVHSCR
jgi:hypothetical protein